MKKSFLVVLIVIYFIIIFLFQTSRAIANNQPYSPVCIQNTKNCYTANVLVCLIDKPSLPQFCENLTDIRGPYKTKRDCKERVHEIMIELPEHRPEFESRAYVCEFNKKSLNN